MDNNSRHFFTPLDKKVFLATLKKYNNIIENKNTDGATLQSKTVAWSRIAAEFNASPLISSQAKNKQLRRLWSNLKQKQRQARTQKRQHRLATGGGPSEKDVTIDPDVEQVAPALLMGIEDSMDSDTFLDSNVQDELIQSASHGSSSAPALRPPATSSRFSRAPAPPSQSSSAAAPPTQSSSAAAPPSQSSPAAAPLSQSSPAPASPSRFQTAPASNLLSSTPAANVASSISLQRQKYIIIVREFEERQRRANQLHEVELATAKERLRAARARADLAERQLHRYNYYNVNADTDPLYVEEEDED